MNHGSQMPESLLFVRRLSQAGLTQCRSALDAAGGDVLAACRSLMSAPQIMEAYQSLRVRLMAGASIKDPPSAEEKAVIEHLYCEVKPAVAFDDRNPPVRVTPLPLPTGIASYKDLVTRVYELWLATPDVESQLKAVAALGFDTADARYVLDRVVGGTFRARMEQDGSPDSAPDPDADPIAFAAYRREIPRKWWQFWKR
jgi:hypothetical protein